MGIQLQKAQFGHMLITQVMSRQLWTNRRTENQSQSRIIFVIDTIIAIIVTVVVVIVMSLLLLLLLLSSLKLLWHYEDTNHGYNNQQRMTAFYFFRINSERFHEGHQNYSFTHLMRTSTHTFWQGLCSLPQLS